jgi:cell division protein FtsX
MNTGPQKTARKIADLIQQIVDIRSARILSRSATA